MAAVANARGVGLAPRGPIGAVPWTSTVIVVAADATGAAITEAGPVGVDPPREIARGA